MLRVSLLLALLGTVLAGGDSFAQKYAFHKIMTDSNCFGDYFVAYAKELHKHSYACKKEIYEKMKEGKEPDVQVNEAPLASFFDNLRSGSAGAPQYVPIPVYYQSSQAVNPFAQFQRQKREALYSGELLKKMVKKVKVKVGSLMCVMRKFDYIDEDKNINLAYINSLVENYSGFDAALKKDYVDFTNKCGEFPKCVEDKDSPIPIEAQRVMAFLKCEKKARLKVCMKADLRKNMDEFDLSGLPEYEGDEDEKVEKLLHVLWGADPGTDPLDLLA